MKVLNLYSGIGGNRKLWTDVEVTAVEIEPKITKIYKDFYPKDIVVIGDAHKFLLKHFKDYDFIWSSPPCQTHSDIRRMNVDIGKILPVYPDMRLYEEIIFLRQFCKCKWVVENVVSYYLPLIKPQCVGRHYFWSNFPISDYEGFWIKGNIIKRCRANKSQKLFKIDISGFDLSGLRKDAILRSYVNPELGKHVFDCAFKLKQKILLEVP